MSPAFSPGPVSPDQVPSKEELLSFSARIFKIGINPLVDVPVRVSLALAGKGLIPVAGYLNRVPIRAALVPAGAGRHRLFLNTAIREAARVADGDRVKLALARDPVPRPTKIPEDLRKTLRRLQGALKAFQSMTASQQREMVVWLENARHPETRTKRLNKILEHVQKRLEG